jgi:hypothetical protein
MVSSGNEKLASCGNGDLRIEKRDGPAFRDQEIFKTGAQIPQFANRYVPDRHPDALGRSGGTDIAPGVPLVAAEEDRTENKHQIIFPFHNCSRNRFQGRISIPSSVLRVAGSQLGIEPHFHCFDDNPIFNLRFSMIIK